MNEQELREKIVGIVLDVPITGIKIRGILGGEAAANNIAEALIAAGIGDISEWKHRAEVAERALRNAAPRLKCRGGLGKGFCRVDKCDYYHCNNDEGCVKAHLQQAEKELQEEGKND